MNVTLWWCESMNIWRWSVTKSNRPIILQESGQNKNLDEALQEIKNSITILRD